MRKWRKDVHRIAHRFTQFSAGPPARSLARSGCLPVGADVLKGNRAVNWKPGSTAACGGLPGDSGRSAQSSPAAAPAGPPVAISRFAPSRGDWGHRATRYWPGPGSRSPLSLRGDAGLCALCCRSLPVPAEVPNGRTVWRWAVSGSRGGRTRAAAADRETPPSCSRSLGGDAAASGARERGREVDGRRPEAAGEAAAGCPCSAARLAAACSMAWDMLLLVDCLRGRVRSARSPAPRAESGAAAVAGRGEAEAAEPHGTRTTVGRDGALGWAKPQRWSSSFQGTGSGEGAAEGSARSLWTREGEGAV